MSGGSMNYLYSRIQSDLSFSENTPQRKAFMAHMQLVIKALHDIEWVDSSDYGEGDENEAIMTCIGERGVLKQLIDDAKRVQNDLAEELKKATGEQA